jgi:hypothetical protein
MRNSFLGLLPSLSLLAGQIAGAAVPDRYDDHVQPADDYFQPAEVDSASVAYVDNPQRATAVKEAFRFAWSGYKNATWRNGKFIWDESKPVDGDGGTSSRSVRPDCLRFRCNNSIPSTT